MSAEGEKLIRCFQAAFGDLPIDAIAKASVETLETWDSLQSVILIAVLEESFEVRIPAEAFPALRSFAAVREYLREGGLL